MTLSNRIVPGTVAIAVSLGLALTPVAYAQDGMKQDLDFKSGVSRDDETRRESAITKGTTSRYSLKKDERSKKGRIPR